MTHFITQKTAVDYISLSTFNPVVFRKIVDRFVQKDTQPNDVQRMQYMGQSQSFPDGSFFWGSGQQSSHDHYLIQVSGAMADRVTDSLIDSDTKNFNVTRIDLQITIPKPDWFKSRSFVDTLRGDVWTSRRRKVTMIDNYGDDTVYIGSRKSDRFARVYVKETDWLRLEFEYKKSRADNVYHLLATHGKDKASAGIMHGEVVGLPDHPVITAYRSILRDYETLTPSVVKPESARFKWFIKQCVPAIITLLNDHDSGEMTRDVLIDLVQGDYFARSDTQEGGGVR